MNTLTSASISFSGPRRRRMGRTARLLTATLMALWLAACGGSGDPADGPSGPVGGGTGGGHGGSNGGGSGSGGGGQPAGPRILAFSASAEQVYVGESVTLRAEFDGGEGRIESLEIPVVSGQPVQTPLLDRDRLFRLVVRAPGTQDVERTLTIRVGFRDRYVVSPLAFAAVGHAAVAADDGSVLLVGGERNDARSMRAIDRYDPVQRQVVQAGSLIWPRIDPVAVRLTDGQVLVTGGSLDPAAADAAELVDERTGISLPAGRMSLARVDHAGAPLGGGRVLVAGGVVLGEENGLSVSRSAEIWEPQTRSFRRLAASMRVPRTGHTMTRLGDGRILIVGGHTGAETPLLAEIFDPVRETFEPVPGVWSTRVGHVTAMLPDGRVLILGGEVRSTEGGDPAGTAEVLRFDPALGLFEPRPPLRSARSGARGVALPDGQLLMFGGRNAAGLAVASAERYDPVSGSTLVAAMPDPRVGLSATRLTNGRVLLIGGEGPVGGALPLPLLVYE